jgi:hypothetical protein
VTDMLQTGSDWLSGVLKTHAAQSVSYRRGSSSVTLSATLGRSLFQAATDSGMITETQADDFIIEAADLVLDEAAVEPKEGDEITRTSGGKTLVYRVLPFGTEPAWRFTDSYRNAYRIHTKLMVNQTSP